MIQSTILIRYFNVVKTRYKNSQQEKYTQIAVARIMQKCVMIFCMPKRLKRSHELKQKEESNLHS